ncbi:hypothetical protein EVAR_80350_1 [Eumeta japonica]|uniref:Uncharacterized protein n=1 Tax=Eumeta variegata TaxID=151549 RepID=A0A4C1X2S8_EUMVA|nr:hypothetical protein EVAR_80350_1 [Eumeta japonica]
MSSSHIDCAVWVHFGFVSVGRPASSRPRRIQATVDCKWPNIVCCGNIEEDVCLPVCVQWLRRSNKKYLDKEGQSEPSRRQLAADSKNNSNNATRETSAVKFVLKPSQWRKKGPRGRRRKRRGALNMRIASFASKSERQGFVRCTIPLCIDLYSKVSAWSHYGSGGADCRRIQYCDKVRDRRLNLLARSE